MDELYKEKRRDGVEYSGLDGRFKALKSSIGEFHASNKKAAPGTVTNNPPQANGKTGRKNK
jgi:hypothetical protein